ncbi:MAG: GntR family transcriptional regulator [Chloroflexi bacterium]|nr:GntR family transcriptional regulator [Chloroflexota bacterium]
MSKISTLYPIQLPSVADVVYDVLRKQILHGHLVPNQQLNLNKLESELAVSRTPLKMALARLQNEGLVEIHPRRGTYVTQFREVDIRECFELRIALEAQALRHTFAPHNSALRQEIMALFITMDGYFASEADWLEQLIDYMDMDRAAHVKIVQLSGNARMQQAYEHANVQGYIAIMGTRFTYADVQKTQAEHREILSALQSGQLEPLLAAARAHLENAGQRAVLRLTGEHS